MNKGLSLSLVVIVGLAEASLSLVGWKGALPDFDHLNHILDSLEFLDKGILPVKGNVTSKGAFAPPGNTWLYLPGVALFDHSGLFENFGSGLLYIGTLVGLFLLANRFVGSSSGLLLVPLFAFSRLGHFFSGSLTAIGNPFFTVWMMYFTVRWVVERDGRFLAAAVLFWGLGMYVFLVIAPALFVLPVLWLIYRPPVRIGYLVSCCVILVTVWSPYLLYDSRHGFENLISQFSRSYIIPDDFERTWYDPSLRDALEAQVGGLDLAGRPHDTPIEGGRDFVKWLGIQVAGRLSAVTIGLTHNFNILLGNAFVDRIVETVLAVIVILSIFIGLRDELRGLGTLFPRRCIPLPQAWFTAMGGVALATALVSNEFLLTRLLSKDGHLWSNEISVIRQFQFLMALIGLGILARRPLGLFFARLIERLEIRQAGISVFLNVLSAFFVVPFLLLVIASEIDVVRRFEWLWPIQYLLLAVPIIHFLPSFVPNKAGRTLIMLVLLGALCWRPFYHGTAKWAEIGFVGKESDIALAVGAVAKILRDERRNTASIGYNIPFNAYKASFNVIDPRYKVGAITDFLLSYEFGINNTNRSAEGVRPDDEFRIITDPPPDRSMAVYIPPPTEGYEQVALFGSYRVYRRVAGTDIKREDTGFPGRQQKSK